MLKDLKQYVPSEVCLSCDGCCRFKDGQSDWRPKVADEEMASAVKEGLASHIFFKEVLDEGHQIKTIRCHDGAHICRFFFLEGNVCTIYAFRPFECQLYPFVLMRQNDKIVLAVHLNCPHIQATHPSADFDRYVAYLQQFFQQKNVMQFIGRNSSLISDYAAYQEELKCLFPVSN